MAHFAKLENNIVEQVIVVSNEVLLDSEGVEQEALGAAFCTELFGGTWIQTSYNGNFRGRYVGIGMIYDPIKDEFTEPIKEEPTDLATGE
jgi:hypothetical protein